MSIAAAEVRAGLGMDWGDEEEILEPRSCQENHHGVTHLMRGTDMEMALPGTTKGDLNTLLGTAGDQKCSKQGQQTGWGS